MPYGRRMTTVEGVDEFRQNLGRVLRKFRADAADAEPVVFGNNRKPEAAVLPFQRFLELEEAEEQLEDLALALIALERQEEPVVGSVGDFVRAAGLDPSEYGVENG